MLLTGILKPEGGREWVVYPVRNECHWRALQPVPGVCTSRLHKQTGIPGLSEWLTWRRVISLEPCWLVRSPAGTENHVHFPRICPWISNHFTGVRAVLGWTNQSIDHPVWVNLRSIGEPVGCDLNSVLAVVSFSWNSVCPTGGRSAVGSCRGQSYNWASKVFILRFVCCCPVDCLRIFSSSPSSRSWRVRHISLFLDPQDEVGPSISYSVVLCFFVRLAYIVVLVLVVCLCPSSVHVVTTFSGTVLVR